MAIYVYDRERSVNNKDKVIGKVSIKKEDLSKYHAKESWFELTLNSYSFNLLFIRFSIRFPILPVDADSEVQGKIHLDVKFDNSLKPGANSSPKIAVR